MMQAAALTDTGQITLVERNRPSLTAGDILVEVDACGICKTDYHMYHGTFDAEYPLVLGHEAAGVVVESRSDTIAVGTRVAINPTVPCNTCSACKAGHTNRCANNTSIGGAGDTIVDGAFAEYVRVPETNVERVGDLDSRTAALAEPLACCIHGLDRTSLTSGDRVALIGAGPIGLLLLQELQNRGAGEIVVSEPADHRRTLASELGADHVVDPSNVDPVSAVRDRVGPVDVAIEAVGAIPTLEQAMAMLKPGGNALVFGVPPQGATLDLNPFSLFYHEQSLVGAYSLTQATFERAVTLLRTGRIDDEPLRTHELSLDELPTAFNRMDDGIGLKQVVRPGQSL